MSWFKFGFGKKKRPAEEAAADVAKDEHGEDAHGEAAVPAEAEPARAAEPDPEAASEPEGAPLDSPHESEPEAEAAESGERSIEAEEPAASHAPETPEDDDVPIDAAASGDAEAPVEPDEPAVPAVDAEAEPDAEISATAHAAPDDLKAAPADGVSDGGDRQGFFARIASGLKKSSSRFSDGVSAVFTRRKLDDAALEELEDLLIAADLGAKAAGKVTAKLAREKFDKDVTPLEIKEALADVVTEILEPYARPLDMSGPNPRVVLFVGVNGSGKTTTLGKIAVKMTREGADVITAAGDTFRAAAVEQLEVWSKRANARFMSRPLGADAAGLAFDALEAGKRSSADAVLIDTAGRLQNKAELMDELRKIVRVLKKQDETAPHHVLLVLDGTVGSNAISQAEAFMEAANVTGVIMTKLDGTAKGGALVQVAEKFQLPIHFIGVGEGEADLTAFDARAFARALAGLEA
ncbi:MAG: signal recognition particle-docking protein FtsY [Oceanicaulis sp.]